jgi:hypothetical protein
VSKQAAGQLLAHILNLTFAIIMNSSNANADECVWYFVNVFVDTTLGVLLYYIFMHYIEKLAIKKKWKVNI